MLNEILRFAHFQAMQFNTVQYKPNKGAEQKIFAIIVTRLLIIPALEPKLVLRIPY